MLSESQVQTKILKYLKSLDNVWVVKTITCNINGVPDILVCYRGRFVAFEVKRESGGVVAPLQKVQIQRINDAGGVAHVVRSVDEVKKILEEEYS